MTRFLAALLAVSAVAGFAAADIPPPPPPKGKKYVDVSHEVKLGKDVKGFVFVAQTTTGPGRPVSTTSKLDLGEKAAPVVTGGRRNYGILYAVPEAAAKEFKTDKELFDAVTGKKVKGAFSVAFTGTATVSDTVKGDTVTWTHTITAVDDKGIKHDVSGDGAEEKKPEKKDEPKKPISVEPGYLIGGLALALCVTFGGLWLVRRKK